MRQRHILGSFALCLAIVTSVQGEIAQSPLVSQTWVPPNLVVTLDDSGSMRDECIPAARCVRSGVNGVNVGSVWRPQERRTNGSYRKSPVDNFLIQPATYNPDSLFARKIRSSNTNSAYYNPQRRYLPWLNADGTSYANANVGAAPFDPNEPDVTLDLSQAITTTTVFCNGVDESNCSEGTETFDPAQYYVQSDGTSGNSVSDFVQYNINSTGATFTKYPDRIDCAGTSCTQTEERQNFANWFTYYRNKWLTAKAVISNTFSVIPPETRLGYGKLSKSYRVTSGGQSVLSSPVDGEATGTIERGVRPFTGDARTAFYRWLLDNDLTTTSSGTPLRGALKDVGGYYMRTDNAGPWGEVPGGTSTAAHIICRRALHLLITDGGWTDNSNGRALELGYARLSSGANLDPNGLIGVQADNSYGAPFGDTSINTLADVAMYYWKTNLRSDIPGSLTGVPINAQESALGREATWPHLVNYVIGFGVQGTLANPDDAPALKAGTKSWPAPTPTNELSKIDDLWHAAWNSGGQYFRASDPKALGDSLQTVIDSMRQITSSDVPLVMPSRYVTSTFTYIPSYQTRVWSGDLQAFSFDSVTGDRAKTPDGIYLDPIWSAAERLKRQDYATRNIVTMNPANNEKMAFDYASMRSQNVDALLNSPNSAQTQNLIDYLRGRSDLNSAYRTRGNGPLGDIVNSAPLLVLDDEDASYDFLPPPSAGTRGAYRLFLLHKKKRRGLVFVGANDGMLHAFDARTGDETFAYIPKTILGSIYRLSEPSYSHRYFVDGPLVEADVYDSNLIQSATVTGWRNLVIGTGGAGARNIFAINVPVRADGNSNTAYAPGTSDILWEINNADPNFSDLGAVLQKPSVGMMRDGTWVVVVGNGYVDNNGTAKLFIINALTGAFIKSIPIQTTGNNGLGGVRLVLDLHRQITAAYAGDLQGNLWKFDFSSRNPSDWGLAFGGNAFYTAKNNDNQVEPITVTPSYLAHPQGGNLVLFGTGKLFENADASDNQGQTLYGLWDRVITGQSSANPSDAISAQSAGAAASGATSELVQQTLTAISGTIYYSASTNAVNYHSKRGWFIRLNMNPSGLRLVFSPQLAVGKVFFQALSPMGNAASACAPRQGKSVNFVLNPFTGSASPTVPTFDVNGDGAINIGDTTYNSSAINAVAVASNDTGNSSFSQKVGAGASTVAVTNVAGQKTVAGAKNALRRTWRQIIRRPSPA